MAKITIPAKNFEQFTRLNAFNEPMIEWLKESYPTRTKQINAIVKMEQDQKRLDSAIDAIGKTPYYADNAALSAIINIGINGCEQAEIADYVYSAMGYKIISAYLDQWRGNFNCFEINANSLGLSVLVNGDEIGTIHLSDKHHNYLPEALIHRFKDYGVDNFDRFVNHIALFNALYVAVSQRLMSLIVLVSIYKGE